jgi:N utilization substance protein B
MASRHEAREWAVQLLFQLDFNPGETEPAFRSFWEERPAPDATRAFVEELVRGVLANQAEIDALIQATATNWNLPRMAGVDRNIMRLAIYEMKYRRDIPHAVSINEAIELAKNMGDSGSPRFVNGILDRIRKDLTAAGGRRPAGGPPGPATP